MAFSEWLWDEMKVSGAGGWALAITELARKKRMDEMACFIKYVRIFLAIWAVKPPCVVTPQPGST